MVTFRFRILQRLLSHFFQLLYTRFAFLYDAVAWLSSMGQWRQWQSAALTDYPDGSILELGHGPGHLQLDLRRMGHRIFGLDPSRQMSRIAGRRILGSGRQPLLVRGRAQALPFPAQTFMGIISTFPSEYILDPETIQEAWRVLSPRGTLTIVGIVEITGRSLPDLFSRWLYRITGQSGGLPEGWEDFFGQDRFSLSLERVILDRAHVTRLVAKRK